MSSLIIAASVLSMAMIPALAPTTFATPTTTTTTKTPPPVYFSHAKLFPVVLQYCTWQGLPSGFFGKGVGSVSLATDGTNLALLITTEHATVSTTYTVWVGSLLLKPDAPCTQATSGGLTGPNVDWVELTAYPLTVSANGVGVYGATIPLTDFTTQPAFVSSPCVVALNTGAGTVYSTPVMYLQYPTLTFSLP